ncbi:60S ribosomal protein L13 [Purpureocillium lavendulum]|uniref:60S ribosomal protein L13 n=1 Tax=Purpureocillium lavendulum TaxID=1247861 RepID=A0AB34FLR3_9HYPO|nr:60S ribosomal protein L13 [Purpureocillium lavendulum]
MGYMHDKALSERLFCSTCGCHVGERVLKPDVKTGKRGWRVASSIFDKQDVVAFEIRTHNFTNSAPGPSLATWLPQIGSCDMHIANKGRSHNTLPSQSSEEHFRDTNDEVLLEEAVDPFFRRYLQPTPGYLGSQTGSTEVLKRVAALCICADCRLVSGAHAVPYTFVPLALLQPPVPDSLEGFGTLRVYRSSERVRRAFCRVCGATVFYAAETPERMPSREKRVVDIAIGVLRAPEGPVAEDWFLWLTTKLDGLQSGREYDEAFADALGKGLAEWGVRTYGENMDFDIPTAWYKYSAITIKGDIRQLENQNASGIPVDARELRLASY